MLAYFSFPKPVLISLWDHFPVEIHSCVQVLLSSYLEVEQSTSTTGSKTDPEHDATATIHDSTVFLVLKASLLLQRAYLLSLSDHKTFSLSRQCGQLQILVKLEGVDFGAGASFLVGTLSVHGDVKHQWNISVTVHSDTDVPAVSSCQA